jgi:hypothetical protein
MWSYAPAARSANHGVQPAEVHAHLSLVALPFPVPSKSKAPQQAISLAPWLPSGIMRLPGRHRWWSGPARWPTVNARQGQRPQQRTRSGRLPVQAGDHLQAPPRAAVPGHAVLPRTVGCAHVAWPGSEVALGPAARTREFARMFSAVVTSASATGCSAPKPALGQVRRGRAQAVGSSAGVIRRAWSLLPGLPHPPRRD